MNDDHLKRYLKNAKRHYREHNVNEYIKKRQDNVVSLDNLKILHETSYERRELKGKNLTKGELIKMCNLCKPDSFHVDYFSDDEDPSQKDKLIEQVCNELVEELIDFSNIPQNMPQTYEIERDTGDYELYESYIDELDQKLTTAYRLIIVASVVISVLSATLIYNLF